jgi:flagellar protein FliS
MARDPARTYREAAVRGATPIGLIVILYEEVIRSIRGAQRGLRENNIEQKTNSLTHALSVIGHLQVTLNFKDGGDIATNLSHFYNLSRARILEASLALNNELLESIVADFHAIARAWQQADQAIGHSNAGPDDVSRVAQSVETVAAIHGPR